MAANSIGDNNEQLNELLEEEKLLVIWPVYPCLYAVAKLVVITRSRGAIIVDAGWGKLRKLNALHSRKNYFLVSIYKANSLNVTPRTAV